MYRLAQRTSRLREIPVLVIDNDGQFAFEIDAIFTGQQHNDVAMASDRVERLE